MIKYLLPVLLVVLTNCASVEPVENKDEPTSIEEHALSEYGEKYATLENKSGSHTIVFKKFKDLRDLFPTVKFFIYEESTQSILFQDELNAGSVNWHSDFKVIATARDVKTEENQNPTSIYYYDVLKREKSR